MYSKIVKRKSTEEKREILLLYDLKK